MGAKILRDGSAQLKAPFAMMKVFQNRNSSLTDILELTEQKDSKKINRRRN